MGAQHPIVIIGSGYAGLQLARQYRRHSPSGPLVIVSADDGAEYAKPQLSHVISKRQAANDLVSKQATELAKELKALLDASGEKGPYVMVAASLGGPIVRMYTGQSPADVAGLVLVDASHEDQVQRVQSVQPAELIQENQKEIKLKNLLFNS